MDRLRLGISPLDTDSEHDVLDGIVSHHTGDDKILSIARSWLKQCLHGHEYCKKLQSAYLPFRLIDIDLERGEDKFLVVDTSTMNVATRYVTLSHRWHEDTPRLNNANQVQFRTATPWKDVPGAYQDAFKITRSLGFRYIWIDSLCICQGDRLDMLSEGLTMMQVYSNAACNIAASLAHSEHIFVDRLPGHVCVVSSIRGQPESPSPQRIALSDHSLWRREVESTPLNQRGWVLQEQLLAARTLYFGRTQVFWECGIGRRCESYPDFTRFYNRGEEVGHSWGVINVDAPLLYSVNDAIYVYIRQIKSLSTDLKAKQDSSNLSTEVLYDMWRNFVRAYTSRTISFSIDKLMAIAGVAKLFADVSNLTWTAGLWKEHMPGCLWWNVSPLTRRTDDVFRAPSWSWAAVDGGVNLSTRDSWENNRMVAQVLDIHCTTLSSDTFSLLTAGTLRLRAASFPLAFDRKNCFVVIQLPNGLILERLPCGAIGSAGALYKRAAFFDLQSCTGVQARSLLDWKPELFSLGEQRRYEGVPSRETLDFDTAMDLDTFDII